MPEWETGGRVEGVEGKEEEVQEDQTKREEQEEEDAEETVVEPEEKTVVEAKEERVAEAAVTAVRTVLETPEMEDIPAAGSELACPSCPNPRHFTSPPDLLQHLAMFHHSQDILHSHPFLQDGVCPLCLAEDPANVFHLSSESVHLSHLGATHATILPLLPPALRAALATRPEVTVAEEVLEEAAAQESEENEESEEEGMRSEGHQDVLYKTCQEEMLEDENESEIKNASEVETEEESEVKKLSETEKNEENSYVDTIRGSEGKEELVQEEAEGREKKEVMINEEEKVEVAQSEVEKVE